jgi:hypothetical protein
LSAGDRKALVGLIAAAWRTIAAIRELAEGRPYHRKLDLDATFALLKGVLVPYAKQFAVGIDQWVIAFEKTRYREQQNIVRNRCVPQVELEAPTGC